MAVWQKSQSRQRRTLFSSAAILVLLTVLFHRPHTAQAQSSTTGSTNYRWFCDLTMNPVVTLQWDKSIGGYVALQNDDDMQEESTEDPLSGWTRRLFGSSEALDDDEYTYSPNLRSSMPEFMHPEAALAVPSSSRNRQMRLQERQPMPPQASVVLVNTAEAEVNSPPAPTVEARACDCWNSMVWGGAFYCTTPRTHCAIPSSPIGLPGCVDVQKQRRIVRSIWPVLVVWYASVLFCLSFTLTGRHALSCCIATIYPKWNRSTADRLLQNDPNQANQMLLRHYRIMRTRYERRLMHRLRRRAQRDRRRARQRRRNEENGTPQNDDDDNHSHSSDLQEDDMPFPNLWDLAIIPRPTATTTGEPQPTTLTLKTRIYKLKDKDEDPLESLNDGEKKELLACKDEDDEEEEVTVGESAPGPSSDSLATTELDSNSEFTVSPPLDDEIQSQNSTEGDEKPETANDSIDEPKVIVDVPEDNDNKSANDDGPIGATTVDPADSNMDLSEWDDNCCTICYAGFEDGDRIGCLPCKHEFHVDPCLKHWLARRNVCPLCLHENIATPNFSQPTGANANQNLSFIVTAPDHDDSMSDQDRSSSRDGDEDDDNSSGILENRNANMVPAFAARNSGGNRPRRMIEMTSIFTRRQQQNVTEETHDTEQSSA